MMSEFKLKRFKCTTLHVCSYCNRIAVHFHFEVKDGCPTAKYVRPSARHIRNLELFCYLLTVNWKGIVNNM